MLFKQKNQNKQKNWDFLFPHFHFISFFRQNVKPQLGQIGVNIEK
jgi:hypothetical protein